MKIINATHYVVTIKAKNNKLITFQPSSIKPKIKQIVQTSDDMLIKECTIQEIEGLPKEQKDIFYIVSSPIALILSKTRNDLLVPGEQLIEDTEYGIEIVYDRLVKIKIKENKK